MESSDLLRVCLLLYGGLYGTAALWSGLAGRSIPYWGWATGDVLLRGGLAGLMLGLFTVALTRVAHRRLPSIRSLSQRFRLLLGPMSLWEIGVVAFASAFGEEAFFRGAMQPSLGLLPTALLFGFLHAPVEGLSWAWTVFALVMGLALGGLAIWEGGLVAPTVAHFSVNALNLRFITCLPLEEGTPADGGSDALQG